MKTIKEKVLEAVNLAQECPENLQQICFEVLLKNMLSSESKKVKKPSDQKEEKVDEEKKDPKSVVEDAAKTQEDLGNNDLHLKVRRLLEKYDLTIESLNQLFYKEANQILPLFEDLNTTLTSESQIRITLLQCLLSAFKTGDFKTTVEEVRAEARTRKCYEVGNWGNNFTNNATLFDFQKYSKALKEISLSESGKEELANLIKELQ